MKVKWEKLELIAAIIGAIAFGLYFLAKFSLFLWHYPVVAGIIGAIGILITLSVIKEKLRRKREGWWVDTATSKEGNYYTYHDETGNEITFHLDNDLTGAVLFVPSPEEWQKVMPDWAKDRRELILARLKQKGHRWIEEADGEYRSNIYFREDTNTTPNLDK